MWAILEKQIASLRNRKSREKGPGVRRIYASPEASRSLGDSDITGTKFYRLAKDKDVREVC